MAAPALLPPWTTVEPAPEELEVVVGLELLPKKLSSSSSEEDEPPRHVLPFLQQPPATQ
jgi:hypothetical protein